MKQIDSERRIFKPLIDASSKSNTLHTYIMLLQRSYRRRITTMVLALVWLFAVSWLPWYIVNIMLITGINLQPEGCVTLTNVVRLIAYLNSACNPYFYR